MSESWEKHLSASPNKTLTLLVAIIETQFCFLIKCSKLIFPRHSWYSSHYQLCVCMWAVESCAALFTMKTLHWIKDVIFQHIGYKRLKQYMNACLFLCVCSMTMMHTLNWSLAIALIMWDNKLNYYHVRPSKWRTQVSMNKFGFRLG